MSDVNELSATGLTRDVLATRADRALGTLEGRTCHSWKMALDRADVLSDPGETAGAPGVALFLQSARGATVTDLDGAVLLDLNMGFGAQLLGHDHPEVRAALETQLARGWQLGLPAAGQLALGRLIQAASPANERVALCSSGSDAALLAMRTARAATGRERVAVFAGSFHGIHDYGLVGGVPDPADGLGLSRKIHLGAGIPGAIDEAMAVLPYGHPASFDMIRRQRQELAAVVVEAVRPGDPHLDAGPWLRELAAVCRDAGVLLILDETNTGFRLAYGGAQEIFGLIPDLTIYGKAVGGGLPLGAVAGRSDLMRVFKAEPGATGIFSASTFAGNPLCVAAAHAALSVAVAERAQLYPALDRAGARLAEGFAAAASALGVPAGVRRAGSMFRIALGHGRPRGTAAALRQMEDVFAMLVLNNGVLLQAGLRGSLSAAHGDTEIDQAVAAFATALGDLKADGWFARMESGGG